MVAMTRTRTALTVTTLAVAGLLGLTACGAAAPPMDLAAETAALAPAEPGSGGARKLLRKNTLHGEVTVQGKDGVRTVLVQRGTVTAVDGDSMSVKSSDGFALTWALGDKVRVRHHKKNADLGAVKAGAVVGVAGARDGSAVVPRLILVE
jgi:hypothetical protein